MGVRKALPFAVVVVLAVAAAAPAQAPLSPGETLLSRAKALELDTPYVPPPGDALEHHASGFAKIMCSAVFITGLGPDFAAENVGFFTGPYAERALVVVRLGHYRGGAAGSYSFGKALALLMQAVPRRN